jgi:hypothetical protein
MILYLDTSALVKLYFPLQEIVGVGSVNEASHKLKEIALRYGLEEIYAFGSRAKEAAARLRGENALVASPGSDRPGCGSSLLRH